MEAFSGYFSAGRTTKKFIFNIILCHTILSPAVTNLNGQIITTQTDGSEPYPRAVSALFLTIAPDARSAGMAEAGVASDPDINSQHWNPAKYAFIDGKGGISASYSPWLTRLRSDIHLGYISGYYRINDKNVLSGSFRYISLDKIVFIDLTGIEDISYHYELAGDMGYSRKFTNHLSGSLVLRYIQSDIMPVRFIGEELYTKPGRSIAGDVGFYYHNKIGMGTKTASWGIGCNVSNIGAPISYMADREYRTPIPTNLRIGGRFTINLNDNNSISLLADANKLLVPTVPEYGIDSITDDQIILHGMEPPESVIKGMIQSFYDAPGFVKADRTRSVFLEEMHEVIFSTGAEYLYKDRYAVRFGYFHEHLTKGGRQFITAGIRARFIFLDLDLSYLIPLEGSRSLLHNTFRISMTAEFGKSPT